MSNKKLISKNQIGFKEKSRTPDSFYGQQKFTIMADNAPL